MRSARIFGFVVIANPAWLLVFALLIVSLVTSVAGTGPGDLPRGAALGVSSVVVALFLLSILAHELAHAMVARRRGLPDRDVQLLTLRGASETEPDPASPLTELAVSSAGPLLSGAVGGMLLAASAIFPAEAEAPLSYAYWGIYWLALANLALTAFHLAPVLPLDGGRLVRALAWRVTGDLDRATRWTSLVGRTFGYLLVGSGLYLAAFADVFAGIWLVMLGWFSGRVSRGAVDRRQLEALTAGLTVEDATDMEPIVIPAALTVDTLMAQDEQAHGPGVYPVLDGERLLGVVFLSSLRRRFRADWTTERALDVLTPIERTPSLRPGEPLIHAVVRLEAARGDALPVLEAGEPPRLVGLITRPLVMDRLRARRALIEGRSSR